MSTDSRNLFYCVSGMAYWIDRAAVMFLVLILLLVGTIGTSAQTDLVPYTRAFRSETKLTPEQAYRHFTHCTDCIEANTGFGFSEDYFWLLASLPSGIDTASTYMLDIDNPHIDLIQVYHIGRETLRHVGRSGDRMPFWERTHANRRNVFQVRFHTSSDQLLMLVDKRNASVTVPLVLWEETAFHQHELRYNMLYGLYFGMLLLIMLYSLLIYLVQRSSVYIWYTVYVAALFLYLFTHVGYGFQFLFPGRFEWNNYLRLIMIATIIIAQVRFTLLFLPVRQVARWLHTMFNGIIVLLIAIILWWLLVPGLFTTYTIVVINVIYGIIGLTVVMLVVALVKCRKADRVSVQSYATAFGANVLAGLLMILEEYGLSLTFFPLPPIFIGSMVEILIFAVGLSYRAKLIGDDRRKLLADINHLQQQAMQAFVRGMEEEKVRVANELHDDVASRLSLLKVNLAETSEADLKEQIAAIAEGVRRISHQLNPVALDEQSFLEKIKQLIAEYRKAGLSIEFQVFDMRTSVPLETGLQLYRILQEALQNVQKHAKAKTVEIQLFQHENELVMTIEDDGVGFDQTQRIMGLGTKNMRLRAAQIRGELSISSASGEGTSIMVSVQLG